MKKIIFALLLSPTYLFAQKSKTFFNVSAEMLTFSNSSASFGGGFSIGGKGKYVDLGVGTFITQFKYASTPYIPVVLDMFIHSKEKGLRPFLNLQAGWGFYNEKVSSISEKGGLFLRPGAGMSIPFGKAAFFIRVFYLRANFSTEMPGGETLATSTGSGWSASLGVSF